MNAREQADYDAYMASRRARAEQEAAQAEQDGDEDELTERRRDYHDMLDRDFQRLGLVER